MAILPTGIGPVTGYNIERSLRFNSADSANLNRVVGTTGNKRKFTFSCWTKISYIGSNIKSLMTSTDNASSTSWIYLNTTSGRGTASALSFEIQTPSVTTITTSAVFRDPSAWYHIVVAVDTEQATDTNRVKFYSNGVQLTSTTGTFPAQNRDSVFNTSGFTHGVGGYFDGTLAPYDGYMAEVYWIDGQQLTPSDFGETDAQTGVWKPKGYSGTYGTNGFFLKFADNSGTTSTTLGKDSSGNGNNYTPNNFSVTAGAGNDSLVDSPTPYGTDTGVGGSVRGNYCTLNPLSTTAGTYTQGNLRYVGASAFRRSNGTLALSTGKWYWEVTLGNNPFSPRNSGSVYNAFGFGLSTVFNSTTDPTSTTDALILHDSGYYKNFSGSVTDAGSAFVSGDVLSIAVDLDANTFTFYKNNSQLVTGTIGGTVGRELVPIIISDSATYGVMDCNFGQRAFAYTAPSGFKALCTQNLPTPAVVQGDDYFNAVLYTGTGTSQSITGVGFQPDLVWVKQRSAAKDNTLTDAVRGTSKALFSNTTGAEVSGSWVTAFNSDGFTVGTEADANQNGITFVGWNWKANGAGVTNTVGSITSTVSANTTSGFSVVTYTGNGSAGATVGHGLGAVPQMIIAKSRSNIGDWPVYHVSLGNTKNLILNTTAAETTSSSWWNNTTPTSTLVTLGNNSDINGSTRTYVMYCFAPVAGYSAFGSYTGNSSTDGPFVYLGFRPRYVLIRKTNSTGNWQIQDTTRTPFNWTCAALFTDSSAAEVTTEAEATYGRDYLSNGMKIRASHTSHNNSGDTYMYMAFAENPFKYSLAR
jgi:hypothetical protein